MSRDPGVSQADLEIDTEMLKLEVDVWKKIIDVQQHFNELEMRIRRFAVTLLIALLGAAGLAIREHLMLLAGLLAGAAFVSWGAFWFMDRHWYHRLLLGAVEQGEEAEMRLKRYLPAIGLTEAIGRNSPLHIGQRTIHSSRKMDLFYGVVGLILLMFSATLVWVRGNPSSSGGIRVDVGELPSIEVILQVQERPQNLPEIGNAAEPPGTHNERGAATPDDEDNP